VNDVACKTIRIGSIKLKMFVGNVRTLKNVRHISSLKKNLISLGALGAAGWKFSGDGTTAKVIKRATVAIKGLRHTYDLYNLIGNTVANG